MSTVWRCTWFDAEGRRHHSWHSIKHDAELSLDRAKRNQGATSGVIARLNMPENRKDLLAWLNNL